MPFESSLTQEERTSLLDGLVRGEYHLLLGAGASIGALGGDGRPLPDAKTLAKEIIADFGVETNGEEIALGRAYQAIEDLRDVSGYNRTEYFANRFSNCRPAWHTVLPRICWQKIWTLNIDDIIEQTYAENPSSYGQVPEKYNWDSLFREPDRNRDELQIIHLHGYALDLLSSSESKLVFSIIEYLETSSRPHAWHHCFGGIFMQRPFIVVGAKLADELDLAEVLQRGNDSLQHTGRPSFVILRDITTFQRQEFRRWGLVPIEAEAQSFFKLLVEELPSAESPIATAARGASTTSLSKEARIFLNQFKQLKIDAPVVVALEHDFYKGDDPIWADIINNYDAQFEIVDRLLSDVRLQIKDWFEKPLQVIHCLWGPPGSGKSTALLRIGRKLISDGFDIYNFQGEERFNIEATFWWLQHFPKSILLFDSLADSARDVGILADKCNQEKKDLLVFSTEREGRLRRIYESIAPKFLRIVDENHKVEELSNVDVDHLIEKLESVTRLGKLTRASRETQRKHFKKIANRQLLVAMIELQAGKPFEDRLNDEYRYHIKNDLLRAVYALTCMSYTFGYPLPIGIVCVAAGISHRELTKELSVSGGLKGIVRIESRGLRPRHRVVASSILVKALDKKHRFQLSQALAKALASYITPRTISQGTLPYRIAREIMDVKLVSDWVGYKSVRDWYDNLVSEYGWNARFWEQRALAEVKLREFPKARSFAEEAVKIHNDPFTRNTLATILLKMATEHFEPGSELSNNYFWEGIAHLRESRRLGGGKFEHPYITFFDYTQEYAKLAFKGQAIELRLTKEWQQWRMAAEQIQLFKHSANYQKLQDYLNQWLLLAVRPI